MNIEHIGGQGGAKHTELWGKKSEIATLEADTDRIEELVKYDGDTIFFAKDEAEVYYLDKDTKKFKVLGE